MNRHQIFLVIIMGLLTAMLACTGSEKSQYESIDPEGWRYGDTLMLKPVMLEGADSVLRGDLSIVVRHTNNYEYSNVWLRMDYANGDTLVTDTINVILADDFGNWLGNGFGVSYQRIFPAIDDVTIDLTQPIKVTHIMRVDTLADIEQIGIVFKPDSSPSNP